jgi:hypothetical protein
MFGSFSFRKQPNGSWSFETDEGRTFEARKWGDGSWHIAEVLFYQAGTGLGSYLDRIEGSYASRSLAADAAIAFSKGE